MATSKRWEPKFHHIVRSPEAKQFVLSFRTKLHVKKIAGIASRTEQEPAKAKPKAKASGKASGPVSK